MDDFLFITQTDGTSGKVACSTSRRVIRAHVMRNHWIKSALSRQRNERTKKLPPVASKHVVADEGEASSSGSVESVDTAHSSVTKDARFKQRKQGHIASPRHQLATAANAFVYAGSTYIRDVKSSRFFHHYSAECLLPCLLAPVDEALLTCCV